jgi:hypothetical protein
MLLEYVLVMVLSVVLMAIVVRGLAWGLRVWGGDHLRLQALSRVVWVMHGLPSWWHDQLNGCQAECGCDRPWVRVVKPSAVQDRMQPLVGGGDIIMVKRCWRGELVRSYLLVGRYSGSQDDVVGLYTQFAGQPRQLWVAGVRSVDVIAWLGTRWHSGRLPDGDHTVAGLVLDLVWGDGHRWQVVLT